MYDRKAKGIAAETWNGLMNDISTDERRETIAQLESDKAPGYDGVSIDLIKLLTQSEESASLETRTELMNVGKGNPGIAGVNPLSKWSRRRSRTDPIRPKSRT